MWKEKAPMNKLFDKLILLILCLAFYMLIGSGSYAVVPVIVAVTISALNSYLEDERIKLLCFMAFTAACIFEPRILPFLPLICFDLFATRKQWFTALSLLPLIVNFPKLPLITSVLTVLFILLALFMRHRGVTTEALKNEFVALQDSAKELLLRLEIKNKELLEKQDYEINLATLHERNRIAREIHDNVGHLLSSSILQIGALMATCKEEVLKESLSMLGATLSQGMDTIRSSIHDLHDKSVDLFAETNALTGGFTFCSIALDYDMAGMIDKSVKYAFLAILKEALSNIMKHSNATAVRVTMREHPAFYQLIIKDNGTKKALHQSEGIGLKNIADRVTSLQGVVNISNERGFLIFISVPKE